MNTRLLLIVALLLTPLCASAQPLADRLPADAIFYAGWKGADAPGAAYAESHLKGVIDASNAAQFCNEFVPALLQRLAREKPDMANAVPVISAIGGALWKHPTALYVGSFDIQGNGQPSTPRVALLCDAGADGEALLGKVKELLLHVPPMGPLKLDAKLQNGIVAVTLGTMSPAFDQAIAGGAKDTTLAGSKNFTAAFGQVRLVDPMMAIYIDVELLVTQLDQAMANNPSEQSRAGWEKARDFLNLKGMKQFVAASGFDGKDWGTGAFFGAPAPRKGLLAMLDSSPLADDAMKVVPKTATWAAAGKLSLIGLFNALRELAGQAPGGREQFDQGIQQVSLGFGLDIQKDVLGAFGDDWVIYTDPNTGGQGMLGFVLVNRLADPAKAEATFTKVEQLLFQILQASLHDAKVQINMQQAKAGDVTLHYLAVPFISPTWAVKDGSLYMGLFPQVVSAAADFSAAHGPSIAENDAFKAIVTRLSDATGGAKLTSVSFADLPRTAPEGYAMWVAISRYLAVADMFGIPSPPMMIPPMHKLMPHMAPSGSITWSDDAGFHARAITPFPGADAIATDPLGSMGMSAPLAVAVLLPSLTKAREAANQVKCASNLRQIGQGMLLYANDHNGKYPADLGSMAKEEELTPAVFICPSGHSTIPAGLAGDNAAAWINAHSDYVYLAAGKTNATPADVVTCYEKPENHQRGVNMLFGDGHVDFLPAGEAMRIIESQQAKEQKP